MNIKLNAYVKLIECPRDAMQGWKNFIPTGKKDCNTSIHY